MCNSPMLVEPSHFPLLAVLMTQSAASADLHPPPVFGSPCHLNLLTVPAPEPSRTSQSSQRECLPLPTQSEHLSPLQTQTGCGTCTPGPSTLYLSVRRGFCGHDRGSSGNCRFIAMNMSSREPQKCLDQSKKLDGLHQELQSREGLCCSPEGIRRP